MQGGTSKGDGDTWNVLSLKHEMLNKLGARGSPGNGGVSEMRCG